MLCHPRGHEVFSSVCLCLQTLQIKGGKEEIEDYSIEDLELLEYMPHKKIAMQMAV